MIGLNYNERRVMELLRVRGPMSRIQLSREMDVSAPTLTRLTAHLIDLELIVESEILATLARGKPSTLIAINPDGQYSIGIHFNPDDLRVCLADMNGRIRMEICEDLDDHSFEHVMTRASAASRKVTDGVHIDRSRIIGCGIAFPGHFSSVPGHLFQIQQFAGWTDVNVDEDFQPYFEFPAFHENDGKAMAMAELYYGTGQEIDNFVMIWLAYGIGGAVVVDRRIYRGAHGNAGEFGGLFPKSLSRPSGQKLSDLLSDRSEPVRRLRNIDVSATALPEVSNWLDQSIEQLYSMIRIISQTLDPEAIVFGGTLPEWVLRTIVNRLSVRAMETRSEDELIWPAIRLSSHSGQPHLGAATIPVYRETTPSYYVGRALKGWA